MKKRTLSIILVLTMSSCEWDTSVRLEGGNPPVFVLSGSGGLDYVVIHGNRQLRQNEGDRDFAMWEVQASDPHWKRGVRSIGSVTYGKAPAGYKQIYPENDEVPPPLVEGVQYEYWFQTSDANGARGYFRIKNGKPEYIGPSN
jgi:hypothetical protein